jgi:serine protease DegQ
MLNATPRGVRFSLAVVFSAQRPHTRPIPFEREIMRRLWLVFAEFVTITLAIVFVITLARPDWNPWRRNVVEIRETATSANQLPVAAGARSASYSEAARKAMVSVVNISSSKQVRVTPNHPFLNDPLLRRFFGVPDDILQSQASLGSGVIVSDKGHILTNDHVVDGATEIQVAMGDGRLLPARLVGSDPDTDLAVLKVEAQGLKPITFGQPDKAQIGDVVLAIGDPFGVGQTVTMGIISALGRNRLGINQYENFIQTDAAINPGNSGGALVDTNGNLIGINSVIYSQSGGSQGIAFAIPVSMVKSVMEQIIASGSVTRGWVGVEIGDVTPDLADSLHLSSARGAIIAGLRRNGPADKGGIRLGDVITQINGKPTNDSVVAGGLISDLAPGTTARFTLIRKQVEVSVDVKVARRPKLSNKD